MRLGIAPDEMIRVRAGVRFALNEAMDEGYCRLPVEQLLPMVAALLEAPGTLVQTAADLELREGTNVAAAAVGEVPCLFLARLYRTEQAGDCAPSAAALTGCAALAFDRCGPGAAVD